MRYAVPCLSCPFASRSRSRLAFPALFLSRGLLRGLTPFRGQLPTRLLPDTSHHRFNVYAATRPVGTVLICIPISNLSALGLHPCSALPARVGVSRPQHAPFAALLCIGFIRRRHNCVPPWIFSALLRHHARPATYTGFAFPGCAASAVSHDPEALFRTFACSLVSCRCQAWASIRQLTVTDHGFLHDGDTHRPAFSLWGISLKPWITFTRCGGQLSRFASFQPCSAPVVYRQPLAACAARSCRIRHPPLMGFLWISTPHIHAIFPTTASVNGRFGDRRLATPACENTGLHRFMPSFMDCSVL